MRQITFTLDIDQWMASGANRPAVPLSIAVGNPMATGPRIGAEDAGVGVESLPRDPNWADREGYIPDFLDFELPLPTLSEEMLRDTAVVPEEYRKRRNDPYSLKYHHYTIWFNRSRRMAWFSAANIDGDKTQPLPKRQGDHWLMDPRIEGETPMQMGEELYATASTDRGHLTRYLDLAWGDTPAIARYAVADTFHFSNCSLQLSDFNQSKERWQGLERFLLEQKARPERRRMTVITGPVFQKTDPLYRNPFMDYSIRIPLQFWKVCALVRRADNSPAVTGFVLGQQDVTDLPGFEAVFDVSAAQITIADLELLTGLRFPIPAHSDHFAEHGPGSLEAVAGEHAIRLHPLRQLNDVVI